MLNKANQLASSRAAGILNGQYTESDNTSRVTTESLQQVTWSTGGMSTGNLFQC